MFPDQATQPPDDLGFQWFKNVPRLSQAEVVPPSSEVHVQLFDNLVQAFAAVAIGQLPDPLLETFKGFGVQPYLGLTIHVEKGEPEEFAQPGSADCAFLLVYLESEFTG